MEVDDDVPEEEPSAGLFCDGNSEGREIGKDIGDGVTGTVDINIPC